MPRSFVEWGLLSSPSCVKIVSAIKTCPPYELKSMSKLFQLKALFDQGYAALGNLETLSSPCYLCPICLNCFDENALANRDLSLEHAPPQSVGGKAIILTCKTCNNTAGHKFEHHLSKKGKLSNFAEVLLEKKEGIGGRACLEFEDMSVNVTVGTEKGTTVISILDKINDPKTTQSLTQTLKRMSVAKPQPSLEFKVVTHDSFCNRKVKLSLLKTAFLIATAKLGYTYARSPALDAIRRQISLPEENVLEHWLIKPNEQLPNRLLAVDSNLGVVIVVIDGESVLLPWCLPDFSNYEKIICNLSNKKLVDFKFHSLAWPNFFEAILDHHKKNY